MSKINILNAERRDRAGKGAARAVRRAGRVPAVIYGNKEPPLTISIQPRELAKELSVSGFFTRMFDLTIEGTAHRVLPRDVQLDPVTDRPLHVDFLRVDAESLVHVAVPVHFLNQDKSPGLKRGGVLNIVRHEIELWCKAGAIPEEIAIDLASYDIGSSIHISMISLPEGAEPAIADRDFTIATVVAPTVEVAVPGEAAPAA